VQAGDKAAKSSVKKRNKTKKFKKARTARLNYIRPVIKVSTSVFSTEQATKRGRGEWANSPLQEPKHAATENCNH
jgi:hypothetical protein